MSSAVAELEAGLQAMLSLKPPGVSGSRIGSLTVLCNDNVQSESVLVQKLYTHFRKAPGSHKLGVLYVVDSVTRKWTEQAKSAGQPINSSAQDGTYAAGVHRVKELLPALMNDIITTAPADQKEKIKKMIDIWEKGQTFPLQMLSAFRNKFNSQNESTTPPGSPPADLQRILQGLQPPPAAPVQAQTSSTAVAQPNTRSILEALANMARHNGTPTTVAPTPVPQSMGNPYNVANAYTAPQPPQPPTALNQTLSFPPPPVNVPPPQATFQQTNGAQNYNNNAPNPFAAAAIAPPNTLSPAFQQQLILVKALSDQGLSHESIAGIFNMMGSQGLSGLTTGGPPPPPPQLPPQNQISSQNGWAADESRDRNGHSGSLRSPEGRFRRRSRSPSPRGWNPRDRRDGRVPDYDQDDGQNHGDDRRGAYRQRSPQHRLSSTPPTSGEKWIGYDESIGKGNIKVLSRTLFVGGVNSGDSDLKNMFETYGRVQTCIINKEKRHAFVKMASRADAVAAKEAMEKNRSPDSQLRTRWGVGFGPRECSDYQTGVSIIPITKLTDADRKWMLTAEFGGSGGKPIEQFMVVEEPDIEIGQGVSSKAISRRLEKTGKPTREREENENPRWRGRDDRRDNKRGNDTKDRFNAVSGPTPMPAIPPFGIAGFPVLPTLPNGMPMFPPGFMFPGQTATPQQPPPPGR